MTDHVVARDPAAEAAAGDHYGAAVDFLRDGYARLSR